jgi:hypothetical protein
MLATFHGLRDASLPKPPRQCIEGTLVDQADLLGRLQRKYRAESVTEVFRTAYAAFNGEQAAKHAAAARRIESDLRDYDCSGELPHYVLYQVKYLDRP